MEDKGLNDAINVVEGWVNQVISAIINTFTLPLRVLSALLD